MMFLNCECPAMGRSLDRSCGSSDHRSARQWLRADRLLG
jgi:hypothetical protein